MRRNWDVIIDLLCALESDDFSGVKERKSQEEISYHSYLIIDMGFAVGKICPDKNPTGDLYCLTSKGHDFLDLLCRSHWRKILEKCHGAITLEDFIEALRGKTLEFQQFEVKPAYYFDLKRAIKEGVSNGIQESQSQVRQDFESHAAP